LSLFRHGLIFLLNGLLKNEMNLSRGVPSTNTFLVTLCIS
jgi:hypothetical protein